jgi:hypothetical protein
MKPPKCVSRRSLEKLTFTDGAEINQFLVILISFGLLKGWWFLLMVVSGMGTVVEKILLQ